MLCDFKPYNGKFKCSICKYETFMENAYRICELLPEKIDKEPSMVRKIANFTKAVAQHLYKGMPTVTQEELDRRLAICKECPLFKKKGLTGGICTHESCGCTIQDEVVFLNKLAWEDQSCPMGKW